MAGEATERISLCVHPRHARRKLPFVNVLMATGATERTEVKSRRVKASDGLMAVNAGNREMSAGEREGGLLMLRDGVVGGFEAEASMAALALVSPWFRRELALVFVLVAIDALRRANLVADHFVNGVVALLTLDLSVRSNQRECGFGVFRDSKGRRGPALDSVAALAFAAVRIIEKLTTVRFGLVAVGAKRVGDGCFEVAALVAGVAGNCGVFADQREPGF